MDGKVLVVNAEEVFTVDASIGISTVPMTVDVKGLSVDFGSAEVVVGLDTIVGAAIKFVSISAQKTVIYYINYV